jgi:hypothetical protein
MKLLTFMAPVILCAVISFQALVISAVKKQDGLVGWSQPLFYAFLPGCFLIMVGIMLRMSRETSRLRRRVARLEGKRPSGGHASEGSDLGKLAADDSAVDSSSHES